jgi:ribonuclease III
MEAHPGKSEGVLSRWRAAVVNEKALARKARDLTLGRFLRLGRGEERSRGNEKDSLLADAYEALLAAVYLDGGFEEAFRVIRQQFLKELEHPERAVPEEDFKTRLQEYTQSVLKVTPRYRLVSQEGPDHDKLFYVEVDVGEGLRAEGSGRSKKEAEQRAAKAMLRRLETDPRSPKGARREGWKRNEGA